jgi:hypothetical protein
MRGTYLTKAGKGSSKGRVQGEVCEAHEGLEVSRSSVQKIRELCAGA